jgi:hypothetical protein
MKAPACLSPYRLAFSRAEDLREMTAASADPGDAWHYCHADNLAALEQAESELAAIIAGEKGQGKTLDPSTLEWVKV